MVMLGRLLLKKSVHFFVLLLVLMGLAFSSVTDNPIRHRLQVAVFDQYNKWKPRPATDMVRIVDIDEASLKEIGQWPWPRTVLAQLVEKLVAQGAKVIAFDVVFAEPDRTSPQNWRKIAGVAEDGNLKPLFDVMPDHDQVFANAVAKSGIVVTGFTAAREQPEGRAPVLRKDVLFARGFEDAEKQGVLKNLYSPPGLALNLQPLAEAAAGTGSFIATPDQDGIIRRVPLMINYKNVMYPSLALESVRGYTGWGKNIYWQKPKRVGDFDAAYSLSVGLIGSKVSVPLDADGKIWTYFRDIKNEEYVSAAAVLNGTAPSLQDKIVFVGTSAEGLRDIRSTPLDIFVPGVEVHVNIVEQILQGKYLLRPHITPYMEGLFIFIVGFLVILLAPFMGALATGAVSFVAIALVVMASWQMFLAKGLLFDPIYGGLSVFILFLLSSFFSYVRVEAERKQVKQAFGLYVAPDLLSELSKNPEKLQLGGETREITVMFTDIRGFTGVSESLTPSQLIQLMNDFLTPMSDLVMKNRGTIDKYMGDAMMAFWNAPLSDVDHAANACRAALQMNKALEPINQGLKEKGYTKFLQAGIGINTGLASVGNMGSRQRFAYSALGDTVNLASRLEGQTKAYGVNLLIGEETAKKIGGFALLELDTLRVKGKEKPAKIFTLWGDEAAAKEPDFHDWKIKHNAFLKSYRDGNFATAQVLGEGLKGVTPIKAYYAVMLERVANLIKNPPQNWDGVFTATEK